ncbi:hypothetical protein, partial [Aggregatibacter actinomycetemcomitans]|uniref:hypothetical protein n=1 Tax=Aggregatibacter actinomycetemcomitans TaxID=714 RepID=UPI001E44C2E0
ICVDLEMSRFISFFFVGKSYFLRFFNLTKSNFVVFLKKYIYGRSTLLQLVSFDANCAILSATFLSTFYILL